MKRTLYVLFAMGLLFNIFSQSAIALQTELLSHIFQRASRPPLRTPHYRSYATQTNETPQIKLSDDAITIRNEHFLESKATAIHEFNSTKTEIDPYNLKKITSEAAMQNKDFNSLGFPRCELINEDSNDNSVPLLDTNIKQIILIAYIFASSMCQASSELNITKIEQRNIVDSPSSKSSLTPKFLGLDTSFLNQMLEKSDGDKYRRHIENLNNEHNSERIWEKLNWDIRYYDRENLPIVIGEIEDKKTFSKKLDGKGLRFLDLPIHMPGQGWRIPQELEQFKEVISKAVGHERILNPFFEKDYYVYMTVDQGIVPPYKTQRRAGWHADSYRKINTTKNKIVNVPVDHIYVIYDCCPTPFLKGPFSLNYVDPEDVEAVNSAFSVQAKNQIEICYPEYTLLRMDPYCVHDAGMNKTTESLHRTFVKISISKVKYAHLGNATNHLFTYDWPMIPRYGVPYTKEAITQSSHRKDRDEFLEVNPSDINFMEKKSYVNWAMGKIQTVYKKAAVKAEPATEGDMIQTKSDGFLTTINVAEKGDYKVTFYEGDQGFMSLDRLKSRYKPIPYQKGWYQPLKVLRRAVILSKNIRFKAAWGTIAYGKKGNYLVYINEEDVYVVPKRNFEESYEILK